MNILQISAGRERSVALLDNGTAYGWGAFKSLRPAAPADYPGQVCSSDVTEIGHNRYANPTPQILNPGAPFTAIADGYVDTLAIRPDGTVLSCRPLMVHDAGMAHTPIAQIQSAATRVAATESCGFALQADGSVWSWGMNVNGQLGRRSTAANAEAAAISQLHRIAALAAGNNHMLALDHRGEVWTWGANTAGQLGNGTLNAHATPLKISLPAPIKGIAAGDTHSFAIDENGGLWAWGSNNFGQIGDRAARYYTRPIRVKTDFKVAQIDAGMFYSIARSADGEVFGWGWNGTGQIAQEQIVSTPRPLRIARLEGIRDIAAGNSHVLASDGEQVLAWGDNRHAACGTAPRQAVLRQPNRVSLA